MSNVRDFGAKGDGKTDDTAALGHAIQQGDGRLVFPHGDYVISQSLFISLEQHGRVSISGRGGLAKLIMTEPGPAIHLVGTHRRSARPSDFVEDVWRKERLTTISGLEIEGRHPEADGILIEGAMQPTLQRLLIRRCRHGIHLTNRNRNAIISDCHMYDNSGIGVFLDRVNLHQINIHGNHISYCKQGGIRIEGSEIRNIQICGNDVEYNFDPKATSSADILFDSRKGTVREGTIVGNTIQALQSPGGANVRLIGVGKDNPNAIGLIAISGNLIASQETTLHFQACRGVVVTGNSLYGGYHNSLVAEDSEHLIFGNNSIDHNPDYKGASTDRVILHRCRNVNVNGLLMQHTRAAEGAVEASIDIRDCQNVNLVGCQLVGARVRGVWVRGGSMVRIADSTIRGAEDDKTYGVAVSVDDAARQVMVVNNFLGRGGEGELRLPKEAGTASGNVTV